MPRSKSGAVLCLTGIQACIASGADCPLRFSACIMGHHSLKAMYTGTPRPMTDMRRQLMNSFLASRYSLLYIWDPLSIV